MKKILCTFLLLTSSGLSAGQLDWFIVKVSDQTNPQGFSTYIAKANTDDITNISNSESKLEFIHLTNLAVIDQSGQIKKPSNIPWGTRFVAGDDLYIRSNSIFDITSVNPKFKLDLDALYK